MGSSGSGHFSDYPGSKTGSAGDGTSIKGGSSGIDKCKQAFSVKLEDVGNSDFYSKFKNVPAIQDQLKIIFDGKRIFAVDKKGVKIGALPTSFNYLVGCLNEGLTYIGIVNFSTTSPIPIVHVDFAPEQ